MKKIRIGPFPDDCKRIDRIGTRNLLAWLEGLDPPLHFALSEHILICPRCQMIHLEALSLARAAEREIQESICERTLKNRTDLIFWIFSLRDPNEIKVVVKHLRTCQKCGLAEEEQEAISEINTA